MKYIKIYGEAFCWGDKISFCGGDKMSFCYYSFLSLLEPEIWPFKIGRTANFYLLSGTFRSINFGTKHQKIKKNVFRNTKTIGVGQAPNYYPSLGLITRY